MYNVSSSVPVVITERVLHLSNIEYVRLPHLYVSKFILPFRTFEIASWFELPVYCTCVSMSSSTYVLLSK